MLKYAAPPPLPPLPFLLCQWPPPPPLLSHVPPPLPLQFFLLAHHSFLLFPAAFPLTLTELSSSLLIASVFLQISADPFNTELQKKPNAEKDNSLNNRVEGGVYHMVEDANNQDLRTFTPPEIEYTQEDHEEVPPIDDLNLAN